MKLSEIYLNSHLKEAKNKWGQRTAKSTNNLPKSTIYLFTYFQRLGLKFDSELFGTLGREIWWYTLGITVLVFGGKYDFFSHYFPKYENSTHEKGTVFTYQLNLF